MENDIRTTLETLLVAQVLALAKTIEAAENARGHSSTDHFVGDAIKRIQRERASILQRLAQTP